MGPWVLLNVGIASKATLAHDRITDAVPVQAVIIGALYVDQRAVCRVVIGDVTPSRRPK